MSFRTFASICKYLKKSKGGVCNCSNKKKSSVLKTVSLNCTVRILSSASLKDSEKSVFARNKAKKQHWMPLISALWDAIILKPHVCLLQWKHCMDSLPGNPQEHNHCEQTQFIFASTGVNANLCHAEREKQINKVQTSCHRLWTWAFLRKTQVKWKTLSRFDFVPNRGCCCVQAKDKNDHLQCYHYTFHKASITDKSGWISAHSTVNLHICDCAINAVQYL